MVSHWDGYDAAGAPSPLSLASEAVLQALSDTGQPDAVAKAIDTPQGDQFRYSAKSANTPGMSPGHMTINRDKRSVVLDLKKPEDRAVVRDLISDADVLIP